VAVAGMHNQTGQAGAVRYTGHTRQPARPAV